MKKWKLMKNLRMKREKAMKQYRKEQRKENKLSK
jgi:hypothetical protein